MVRGECSNIDRTEVMQHLKIGLAWSLKHLEGVYFGSTSGKKKFDQQNLLQKSEISRKSKFNAGNCENGFCQVFLSLREVLSVFFSFPEFFCQGSFFQKCFARVSL